MSAHRRWRVSPLLAGRCSPRGCDDFVMLDGVDDAVGDGWHRVVRWLTVHAPFTAALVRGPAEAAVVDAIARDLGSALPADLRAWWALTDGFRPGAVEALIPAIHT